jgi:hypothetical protein
MIHYHGGTFRTSDTAARFLFRRHAFLSFSEPNKIGLVAEVANSFALDNGAFSFWKSKKPVDWEGYYRFVEKWHRHPGFDFALIPDVIEGTLEENKDLISSWPFSFGIGVPIWHLHEPIMWAVELCHRYPRVAIGSSGVYANIGSNSWWDRMCKLFNAITDELGRPLCKIHGLRMLNPSIFTTFPFSSCDSANVDINCSDGSRWTTYNPPTDAIRAMVLAERIEAFNSKPFWDRKYIQVDLFSKPETKWI